MIALCFVGAVFTFIYWALWFVNRDWLACAYTDSYFAFENSFPLADAWLAVCFWCAGFTLWKRRETWLLWLLLAGSASVYLGAMDVLFDLQNGIYRSPSDHWPSVIVELVINVFCFAVGTASIVWGWWNRHCYSSAVRQPASHVPKQADSLAHSDPRIEAERR